MHRRQWEQRIQQWQGFEAWVNTSRPEEDVSVHLRRVGEMMDFWLSLHTDGERSRARVLTTARNVRRMHEKLKGTARHDRS